ncbi:MAG: VWA domain-containing protein [Bryobacterales bacterium]|nr:VWA domain-containing protein [Bryobacterales bacterium]
MKTMLLTLSFAAAMFARQQPVTEGTLTVVSGSQAGVACPLKHTTVESRISGFLARTTVTQVFENTMEEKIEAVYVFPLPQRAAVDDMTMVIGDRTIHGIIKTREEARAIYEAARNAGQTASLLDQERPNIFTQSVTNIVPGAAIRIKISYVETLRYEAGTFEFQFPMVVGPRYIPRQTRDASRLTPPVAQPGTRAGHDISLEITLDAGFAIGNLNSPTHEVVIDRTAANHAAVRLKAKSVIPNKDFILRYSPAANRIEDALLMHHDKRGGFFSLILTPPARIEATDVTPKELVFVLDTSGSMEGFPIEKAKEAMGLALDGLYPQDTFNLITFSGDTHVLFPQPVPATPGNLARAHAFLTSRQGRGGTEMMKAIRAALDSSDKQDHIRIVCFMTDGYVGNDFDIIDEIGKHPNARVFSFGIGSSVNRFLLDKMAEAGRGDVEYVGLNDDGSAAAARFHERVRNPLLTDITVDWGGLPVSEVYPARIPDLFGAKPVVLAGRYSRAAAGVIKLRGRLAGRPFERSIRVSFPAVAQANDAITSIWAREKVEYLMAKDWTGLQRGSMEPATKAMITQLGLEYQLMTQFTSFVAVEDRVVTDGGKPAIIQVPVEMPEGVSYEGVFGEALQRSPMKASGAPRRALIETSSPIIAPGPILRGERTGSAPPFAGPPKSDTARVSDHQAAKLDPRLVSLLNWHTDNPTATTDPAGLMKNGRVEIRITLTSADEGTLAQLKQLGVEVIFHPHGMKLLIGRIPVGKLHALAQLPSVTWVGLAR